MADVTQKKIDDLTRALDEAKRKKAHPDAIAQLQIAANILLIQSNADLARSNTDLVAALKALTDSTGKNNGTLKDAITTLANKIADLGKK